MKINLIIILFLSLKVLSIYSLPSKKDPSKKSKLTLINGSDHCAEDVRRLCGHMKKSDDLTLLNCLQDNEEVLKSISSPCQNFLWSYKKNLTTSTYLEELTSSKCSSSVSNIEECKNVKFGHKVPCLLDHKDEISDKKCHKFLNKVGIIVFSDYHLIYKFVDICNNDITKFKCGRLHIPGETDPDDEKELKGTLVDYVTSQTNTMDCLVNSIADISRKCQHEILRLSELQSDDYHLNRRLYLVCREDRDSLCANVESGDGRVYACLMKHKFDDRMTKPCQDQLTKKQQIESMDAKVDYPLFTHCKNDIEKNQCQLQSENKSEEVLHMSTVLLCLEDAMNRGKKIDDNCRAELSQKRLEMLEDFNVSPEVVKECDYDVKQHCDNSDKQPGAVLHCLMGLAAADDDHPKGKLKDKCRIALTHLLKVANPTEDIILLDPTIRKSCSSSLRNLCGDIGTKDQAFQCLVENIASPDMAPDCHRDLTSLLYFVSYDFRIDSAVERACHLDAVKLCNGPKSFNETQHRTEIQRKLEYYCMYTKYKEDRIRMDISAAQGVPVSKFNRSLSVECGTEIFRLIKAQASQIQLDPIVFESCLADLNQYCKSEPDKGHGHECLQKNFDKLESPCKKAVIDFSQMEDVDVRLNRQLTEACMPMTKLFCKNSNPDDMLQCLIFHKRHADMTPECQSAIEHVQIMSLEEYKIDHRFAKFCEKEINKYCSEELQGSSKMNKDKVVSKVAIVSCLSKTVVKELIEGKQHPLSKMCRRQFSFELLQRSDSVKLDQNLSNDCHRDIENYCKNETQDQISTCLRKYQDKLEAKCHRRIFRRERMESLDANFDGKLKRVCFQMIDEYCHDVSGTKLFQCLHKRINEVEFDEDCRQLIYVRLERRMHDIRLNPELLADCKYEIKLYCSKDIKNIDNIELPDDVEYEGVIIQCLKEKFSNNSQQLRQNCRQRVLKIIIEANANLRLDPILRRKCEDEIHNHCEKELMNKFDPLIGSVHDCLKVKFLKNKISSQECGHEIHRLLKEGKADVHVDSQLFNACEDAIMKLCPIDTLGEGRKMNCLLTIANDKERSSSLNIKCLDMIRQRQEMWTFAAKFEFESLHDIILQLNQSSMRTYLFSMIGLMIFALILLGICCGRVTKRVPVDLKNK